MVSFGAIGDGRRTFLGRVCVYYRPVSAAAEMECFLHLIEDKPKALYVLVTSKECIKCGAGDKQGGILLVRQ